MINAICAAWEMLQSSARPGIKYWQDITQVVEMMEFNETRCINETELRDLRKQVLQTVKTATDDQGHKMFLVQGITDSANRRRTEITELVIKMNTRRTFRANPREESL